MFHGIPRNVLHVPRNNKRERRMSSENKECLGERLGECHGERGKRTPLSKKAGALGWCDKMTVLGVFDCT